MRRAARHSFPLGGATCHPRAHPLTVPAGCAGERASPPLGAATRVRNPDASPPDGDAGRRPPPLQTESSGDADPRIRELEKEIASLREQMAAQGQWLNNAQELARAASDTMTSQAAKHRVELHSLQNQAAGARAQASTEHTEVMKLRFRVARLQQAVQMARRSGFNVHVAGVASDMPGDMTPGGVSGEQASAAEAEAMLEQLSGEVSRLHAELARVRKQSEALVEENAALRNRKARHGSRSQGDAAGSPDDHDPELVKGGSSPTPPSGTPNAAGPASPALRLAQRVQAYRGGGAASNGGGVQDSARMAAHRPGTRHEPAAGQRDGACAAASRGGGGQCGAAAGAADAGAFRVRPGTDSGGLPRGVDGHCAGR